MLLPMLHVHQVQSIPFPLHPGRLIQTDSSFESNKFIATAKWFCNCSVSLRPADCVVKPRRCAASPAFYALSTELMKTDHFTKPLRGGYSCPIGC
jgi:hypothetical protein